MLIGWVLEGGRVFLHYNSASEFWCGIIAVTVISGLMISYIVDIVVMFSIQCVIMHVHLEC